MEESRQDDQQEEIWRHHLKNKQNRNNQKQSVKNSVPDIKRQIEGRRLSSES
jgi:hypothetical protein